MQQGLESARFCAAPARRPPPFSRDMASSTFSPALPAHALSSARALRSKNAGAFRRTPLAHSGLSVRADSWLQAPSRR